MSRAHRDEGDAAAPPSLHCFGHAVEDVAAEVRRTGSSRIAEEITDECRGGLDRCRETDPQGGRCLGNVRRVVQQALDAGDGEAPDGEAGVRRTGSWAAAAARPPRRAGLLRLLAFGLAACLPLAASAARLLVLEDGRSLTVRELEALAGAVSVRAPSGLVRRA